MVKKNKFIEIGIILNILAVSIAIVLKEVLKIDSSNITYIIYFLSVVLTTNWKALFKKNGIRLTKKIVLLLALQIYILICAFFSSAPLMGSSFATVYTLFVIVYIFSLSTNITTIDEEKFMSFYIIITSILSCLSFLIVFSNQSDITNMKVTTLENGAERSTLASVSLFYLFVFLVYKPKRKIIRVLLSITFGFALCNMLICNRRIVYITALVCTLVYFWKNKKKALKFRNIAFLLVFIPVIIIIFRILLSIGWVNNMFDRSLNALLNGINTFFDSNNGDASVMIRNENRELALNAYRNNNIFQYFFGRGYGYMWIDFPLFEAFLDLGIIAGFVYFYLTFYLVLKQTIFKKSFSQFEYIVLFGAIAVSLSGFASGMPYGNTKYCPIILFLYFIEGRKTITEEK